VAYSAKQNATNTDFIGTSCIYVVPLVGDEVLVFSGGYGDTWYLPGGAFFDADYDANNVFEAIVACMGRDPELTKIRFVAPHGHPDHVTVAFIRALERTGMSVVEIAYHEGDRAWIEQLPWLDHHPSAFRVLESAPCNREILSYESPLGKVWFSHRPGHTPGSIDMVLDLFGDEDNRVLVRGSADGGCSPPSGVFLDLNAHGTAQVRGRRRAQAQVIEDRGINSPFLRSVTLPRLGATWVAELDATDHPGATKAFVLGTDCRFDPGVLSVYGEVLVNPRGRTIFQRTTAMVLDKESMAFPIPQDAALMGKVVFVQASLLGDGARLSNGLRLVIGF
jgi:hypothetical protein